MKCEKCGKNEVSFHYSSNINGKITEKHLCSECAAEFEHSEDYTNTMSMFDEMNGMFNNMFGSIFERLSLPGAWDDFGFRMPTMVMPRINIMLSGHPAVEEHREKMSGKPEIKQAEQEVDEEMNKRRRLNELRAMMEKAAKQEDYEKAIELREQIKALESGEEKDKYIQI